MSGTRFIAASSTAETSSEWIGSRRYFDRSLQCNVISIMQGEYYASGDPNEVIATLLGSCIAVCMHDPVRAWGGMNHFLLPNATRAPPGLPSPELRYGSYSIERLLNTLIECGCSRKTIETKVFGGANVSSSRTNVGHRNSDFVEQYLANEGLTVSASQLRGEQPRRLRFYPTTGRVQIAELAPQISTPIDLHESKLRQRDNSEVLRHRVELFKD